MNVSKPQIMIVDDSPTDLQIMLECLKDDCTVATASSGEKALDLVESGAVEPKVILMDVSMPGMDGYDTCRKLKRQDSTSDIEVIFVSAHGETEEKKKGYEAGGSDYLIKPVQADELINKVQLAVRREALRRESEEQSRSAMQTAMAVMMDAGEQASVIHFLRDTFTCNSVRQLAELVINSTAGFDLANTVQIRLPWETITLSSQGVVPPLEVEMLTALKDTGRLHHKGKRMIINMGAISHLTKNMPVEDEEKCGRLRDHLALIIEGAYSRLDGLLAIENMRCLMEETNSAVNRISELQSKYKARGVQIMDNLEQEIREHFLNYGLTDEQEDALVALIESTSEKILSSYEESLKVDEELAQVTQRVARALENNTTG